MRWHRFDRSTLPATPWRNGGGRTREIVCWPPGPGLDTFDWRVSIATIASDGPFSAFPGIDRVITLLEGAGVHLASDDGAIDHRLDTPLQPFVFPGEARIDARLLAGSCEDFNVMTRRSACRAEVQVLRQAATLAAPAGVLLSLEGVWGAQPPAGTMRALPVPLGLWWQGATPAAAWHVQPQTPQACLLAVTIHPQPAAAT